MKKFILVFLALLISDLSYSQIKQRSTSTSVYAGIGYKFVYLTDPQANDAYPFFQLSSGDFLKEINGFLGVTINESYGIEFSPSYLFTNTQGSDGFYFDNGTNRRFYVPVQTRLFALPMNLRFKYYPFAKNYASAMSKVYFGIGAGAMYVDEEISSQIYQDESAFNYIGAISVNSDFWTTNYEFLLGIGSFSKIGYGFELSYRLVPLDNSSERKPLITYIASNFNSINLAANIVFTF
jgi:hypothetical protein